MWEPGALVATPASTFTADHEGLLFALIEPGGYLSSPPPTEPEYPLCNLGRTWRREWEVIMYVSVDLCGMPGSLKVLAFSTGKYLDLPPF